MPESCPWCQSLVLGLTQMGAERNKCATQAIPLGVSWSSLSSCDCELPYAAMCPKWRVSTEAESTVELGFGSHCQVSYQDFQSPELG